MPLANVLFIVIGTAIAWWLSGYDARVTGANPKEDLVRRAVRCGITLVLLAMATLNGFVAIFVFLCLGILWAGCGAEFVSHQFHKLMDPEDKREFDAKEGSRKLDLLAQLLREGRNTEALDLCQRLEKSGEASPLTIDATLHRLYQEALDSISTAGSLAEIRRLCEAKRFDQAELQLKQIIAGQPQNWPAMLLLMRIYAEGLSQPAKALALLQPVGKQPGLHPAFAKYARKSIEGWSKAAVEDRVESFSTPHNPDTAPFAQTADVEVSVDELLKSGRLTAAIEYLEKETAAHPQNFELWLKLAEAHAVYCRDINRAGKIIRSMELSSKFTPQEMGQVKATLKAWQAAAQRF